MEHIPFASPVLWPQSEDTPAYAPSVVVPDSFNEGVDFSSFELSEFLGEKMQDIVDRLDDQSLQTIRQTIMTEYARCTKLPDSAVVKSFDGTPIATETATERDIKALNAIRAIIADSEKNG